MNTQAPLPLAVAPMQDADVEAVVALWQRCGLTRPWNDPRADIALALRGAHSAILVGRRDESIVASVMVGHDGHRGWLYYLAVDPDARRQRFGALMTAAAEDWLRLRGIGKAMLMVRADNADVCAFYNALGYGTQERMVFAKWLDGRAPTP
jgi:ribosomal protein S18 acetylase RimI-like enzyme